MKSVTVVVPTIGRDTLARTLESLVVQTEPCDEILVVSDGPASEETRELVRGLRRVPGQWKLVELGARAGDYGGTPRNVGIRAATGDVLWFMDDDDVATPGALELIRQVDAPTIFRMESPTVGWTLWKTEEVAYGNVGTPMIATPRYPDMPEWGRGYQGDFDFAVALAARYEVAWRPEVVALIRP